MGYSNYYTLKLEGKITKQAKVSDCQCHTPTFDLSQNFCSLCGAKLYSKEIELEAPKSIIKELVTYNDDCGYLLDENGRTNECGSGYEINKEIKEFSKKYPSLTFILTCQWETGLLSEGEPGTDYFFFKNGVEKKADAKIVYTNPFTGEQF